MITGPIRLVFIVLAGLASLMLAIPTIIIAWASLGAGNLVDVPPEGYTLDWYRAFVASEVYTSSLINSLIVAGISTVVATVTGVFAAFAIRRSTHKLGLLLESIFLSPLLVPSLIIGLAVMRTFALAGLAGTIWALVLTHAVLTLPLVIRMIVASLAGLGVAPLEAAASLGASPPVVFRRVTLPLIGSGVAGGALFAFIVSLGELNASLFVASSGTLTLPIQIFTAMELESSPVIAAASTVVMVLAISLAFLLDRIVGLRKIVSF